MSELFRLSASDEVLAALIKAGCTVPEVPDCGEAGHDDGRCGNVKCLGRVYKTVPTDTLQKLARDYARQAFNRNQGPDNSVKGLVFLNACGITGADL